MVKKHKILALLLISGLAFGGSSGFEQAQNYIVGVISNILRFLFAVLMIVASIMFIWLGINYILGRMEVGGQKLQTRQALLYLVLGIVLLILSFFIPNIIRDFVRSNI